jgi:hypothetical protein
MLVVSSKEFKSKQALYFDRADNGEKILVQRSKHKSYTITPWPDDTLMSQKALYAIIERGLQDIKDGKDKEYSLEELRVNIERILDSKADEEDLLLYNKHVKDNSECWEFLNNEEKMAFEKEIGL